jgi:hypothetical protein
MKRLLVLLTVLTLALAPAAFAKGGGFGGGGGGFKGGGGGGGFKSSGGSKSAGGGGGSKSYSGSKAPTASKPSSGPVSQRAPMTRIVPKSVPPRVTTVKSGGRVTPAKVTAPPGHNVSRDYGIVTRGSYRYHGSRYYYGDPYGPSYYGSYDSPFFYMWLFSTMDNDSGNDPQPPEPEGNKVSDALESYLGVVQQTAQFMADKAAK